MNLKELNSIPEMVKNGQLSIGEASNKLWELIYRNPRQFDLAKFDEDQRSDFLLYIAPTFKNMILRFREGPVEFFFYVYSSIHRSANCWLKRHFKHYAADICAAEYSELDMYTDETKAISLLQTSDWENKMNDKNITDAKKTLMKNFIHVLACKACNDIDDEMVSRIADFIEMPASELNENLRNLQKSSEKKIEFRRKLIERRNKAYFFHKKYRFELEHVDPEGNAYILLKEKYEKQTKSWKRNNELLEKRNTPGPTAEEIAFTTGIKPRTVWFYLNHAKNRKEFFPFID